MLIIVGLLGIAGAVFGKLVGDHVCPEEQRYTVNVTEYVLRNTTLRHYKWCLNVPPRCSFYTARTINESRVVEKEVTDFVDKCCSGYEEDKSTNRCTPVCPHCINGTCVEGKCECFPGYKGEYCDTGCDKFEWGRGCRLKCDCNGSACHPKTGNCECPAGWTGNDCELPCKSGFWGPSCTNPCTCDQNASCDPITGHCDSTSSPSPISSSPTPTEPPPPTNIQFTNNGKFELGKTSLLSTNADLEITETPFPLFEDGDKSKIGQMPVNNYISISNNGNNGLYASTIGTVQIMKSKAKVKSKEVSGGDEENFLNDETRRGSPEDDRNDLVSSASAATAISAGIIIVAGVIVAANHFKKMKGQKEDERNKGVSTVAVYTHSIFHTPLPEPPIFENPIFASPVETNPAGEGRIETHVVCSMNFPAPSKDPRDFLYDHPPSTGSYRAASIPEPPDIDTNQSGAHPEPLYDEIPSGIAPTPVSQPPSYKSSLYMNTCGKTRF